MELIISNSNNKPIYEQIATQIKAMILSGALSEGDILPSMRLLAKDLRISVITTKRAYEELEKDGFIVSSTGRGTFVAEKNLELVRENNLRQIEELFCEAVDVAKKTDIKKDELTDMISLLFDE